MRPKFTSVALVGAMIAAASCGDGEGPTRVRLIASKLDQVSQNLSSAANCDATAAAARASVGLMNEAVAEAKAIDERASATSQEAKDALETLKASMGRFDGQAAGAMLSCPDAVEHIGQLLNIWESRLKTGGN